MNEKIMQLIEKNNWIFKLDWISILFCLFLLNIANTYFAGIINKTDKVIYIIFANLVFGIFLALLTKKLPWFELLVGWIIFELLTNLSNFLSSLLVDYIISFIGACLGLTTVRILKNLTKTYKTDEILKAFLKEHKNIRIYFSSVLIFTSCILWILLFLINNYNRLFSSIIISSTDLFLILLGIISGYLAKKVPIYFIVFTYVIISLTSISSLFFFLGHGEFIKFVALVGILFFRLVEYYIGNQIGYRVYSKTKSIIDCELTNKILDMNFKKILKGE